MNNYSVTGKKKIYTGEARALTRIALFVSLLAISSYISFALPFSPVPVTAQTLIINLTALIFTPKQVFKTMAVFLLSGALGLPVFAQGTAGIGVLLGPTGGYFFGYLAAAVMMSFLRKLGGDKKSFGRYLLVTLAGVPVIYFFGAAWLMYVTSLDVHKVWMAAVLPFIPGDVFKCAGASLIALALNKALKN